MKGMEGDELIRRYEFSGVPRVKLGIADIDGVIRGKYISLDKFRSVAAGASGFCDCVLGWDVDDQLYDNAAFTGWHTGFPDATYRLDLATERRLADENDIPYFIGEFVSPGARDLCPRSLLKRVLAQANDMGYVPMLAFEYEFFVFRETAQSVRDKGYRNLVPLSPGNFGYSVLRTLSLSDLFTELMDYCVAHDFPLEGLHCETGPGVWEAAISVDDALAAADKAALFKTFTKAFFQKRDMIATFMAKWSMDYPGQSGHCHQSLFREDGTNAFHDKSVHDKSAANGMSNLMERYVAGLQVHGKALLPMTCPTVNSYARLVRGAWAPTASTWGIENRTAALRVIPGDEKSQRVEFRVSSADANPYLVAAANIAAGLAGIRDGLELPEPVTGNAYEIEDSLPEALQFPGNLRDATRCFESSDIARQMFGDAFVEHFAASRHWEARECERHVNDWQLERYFEII